MRGELLRPGAALIFGVLPAALVGSVIFGGITTIGRVTSRLVPAMAIIHIGACVVVIGVNLPQVPAAFGWSSPVRSAPRACSAARSAR